MTVLPKLRIIEPYCNHCESWNVIIVDGKAIPCPECTVVLENPNPPQEQFIIDRYQGFEFWRKNQ
jgi:hypothetical protein